MSANQFHTALPGAPASDRSALWSRLRERVRAFPRSVEAGSEATVLESGLSIIASLNEAPPRTTHSTSIMRASPMSASVRAMIERREFGRRFDALDLDPAELGAELPALACPDGDVEFLASDASFEELSLSVDCLLRHRRRLLSASVDTKFPRRNVLVLGAGPGGLMAAIELCLRGHRVLVCEQREVYTRNRFIGVYKHVAHSMAALGMPERMTYDFTHYRGKRGLMLADIQTFLHGIALKVGAVVYTGALVRDMNLQGLERGQLELHRVTTGTGAAADAASAIGMTRWRYDSITRVRSGVSVLFDAVLEATGGRSGARELLVGRENVVSLRTVGRDAARRDPTLDTYFDDPDDHCAQFVESDYGCPQDVRREFSTALQSDDDRIPDELPGLVSNIDASIVLQPVEAVKRVPGVGARIGDRELDIPRDWVLVRCPLPDRTLTRYQIEGPLPRSFEFGGQRIQTKDCLAALNPVTLLVRLLYAMGVPFEAVDRQRLVDFYTHENSQGDASDIVAAFVGQFRGLRLVANGTLWRGRVPGSGSVDYGIIGEALQNAWYRFGVGVDDTFEGALRFAEGFDLDEGARAAAAARFERVMSARSVQVLYHLWLVEQNTEQGVVGPVLTECYIDRRYRADLAEARLRDEKRNATSILAALVDLRSGEGHSLLDGAVEHRRDLCCRTVLGLLSSFDYDPQLMERATHAMRVGMADWRARAWAVLEGSLSEAHTALVTLLCRDVSAEPAESGRRSRAERLVELGMGRYDWASPWVRACALRSLDPSMPGALDVLTRAASEKERVVAEAASAALAAAERGERASTPPARDAYGTIDKVLLLKEVRLFTAIPHEELADVAHLLGELWVSPGERIVEKGEVGDCLYVVASGRVRVHDGERMLAELGRNQFFGELSLLDAEPRAASVTALEESRLFRLGQGDFYAIIAARPQILHALNRALCQMVRGMLS